MDGHSILTALQGGQAPQHEHLYWDYGHTRGQYKQAVRQGGWKAVRSGQGHPIELYDVQYDIGETQNVAAQHPDIVARMEHIMATAATADAYYPIASPKSVKRQPK